MLRDVLSGLFVAAATAVLFALVMHFGPVSCNFGDDAWNLLVLVGIVMSAGGLFAEVLGSRLNRGLREASAEIDERSRLFDESIRARALRLNAYALAPLGCTMATDATAIVASQTAKVIPFPARRGHLRRATIEQLGGAV
jgi:hypothetical protein